MSFRRVAGLALVALATLLWISCGDVYRPVVIPVQSTPPNPANFHQVFAISSNVSSNPGTAFQIDVAGDSTIGSQNMGINPTHAAVVPNNSRVFVASAGSTTYGESDVVTSFTPAIDSVVAGGLGNPIIYTLPNVGPNQTSAITSISESGNVVTVVLASAINQAAVGVPIVISGVIPGGYNGNFTITSVDATKTTVQFTDPIGGLVSAAAGTATVPLPTFCSYQPNFVTTTQSNAVYVANYGQENGVNCNVASTDSIAALSTVSNTITHIQYLGAGTHPILMAETPNAQNLFVVNQGNGTSATSVLNLSSLDLSTVATIPIGVNPAWIAMRVNGQRVYVVTQGDGALYSIDTVGNAVASTVSVGAGANYVLYDKNLDRLYVTNPTAGVVYVFSATTDPPTPLGGGPISIPAAPPCAGSGCGPVTPVSVAALPDGSRFYVASYQIQSPCSDPNVTSASCLIPMLTIFDAKTFTIKNASSSLFAPALSLLTNPPFGGPTAQNQSNPYQYAVPELASCVTPSVYTPGATRFRMFATSATDGSHVYVSVCDAGAVADIVTNTNTLSQGTNAADRLVIDLLAPFSAAPPGGNNQPPPPQSPLFLFTGQ